jgi:hypothetical protein
MDINDNWKLTNESGWTRTYVYVHKTQIVDGFYYEMLTRKDSVVIKEISGNDERVLFDGYLKDSRELSLIENLLRLSKD